MRCAYSFHAPAPNMSVLITTTAAPTAAADTPKRRYSFRNFFVSRHSKSARMPRATPKKIGKSLVASAKPKKPPAHA